MWEKEKKAYRRRKGSALILIIAVMIFVTAASALVANLITNNRRQAVLQSENMQLYYLIKAGLDLTVESLVNESGQYKVSDYKNYDPGLTVPKITFKDENGNEIGESEILVKRVMRTNGAASEAWVEITAATTMRDILTSDGEIERTGRVFISVKNPLIREYDIVVS